MALTVTVNKYASLNVQAIPSRRESTSPATSSRRTNPKAKTPVSDIDIGRRGILVSTVAATPQVKDSTTEFLKSTSLFPFFLDFFVACVTFFSAEMCVISIANFIRIFEEIGGKQGKE